PTTQESEKTALLAGPAPASCCEKPSNEAALLLERHQASAAAQEEVLLDPRVEGLSAISDYLKEGGPAPVAVLLKALELLEKLDTRGLNYEVLGVLPRLIELSKGAEANAQARSVLLKILATRSGKASLEEAIGQVAPLLEGSDAQLADVAEQFLSYHTGMKLGKDAKAWKGFQQKMVAERQKAKLQP